MIVSNVYVKRERERERFTSQILLNDDVSFGKVEKLETRFLSERFSLGVPSIYAVCYEKSARDCIEDDLRERD